MLHEQLALLVGLLTARKPCLALFKMIVVRQIGRYVLLVARRRSWNDWSQTKCAILRLDIEKKEVVEWANQRRELSNVASLTVLGLLRVH